MSGPGTSSMLSCHVVSGKNHAENIPDIFKVTGPLELFPEVHNQHWLMGVQFQRRKRILHGHERA